MTAARFLVNVVFVCVWVAAALAIGFTDYTPPRLVILLLCVAAALDALVGTLAAWDER